MYDYSLLFSLEIFLKKILSVIASLSQGSLSQLWWCDIRCFVTECPFNSKIWNVCVCVCSEWFLLCYLSFRSTSLQANYGENITENAFFKASNIRPHPQAVSDSHWCIKLLHSITCLIMDFLSCLFAKFHSNTEKNQNYTSPDPT